MSMARLSVASGLPRIALLKSITFKRVFRLGGRYGTRVYTFWIVVWSLFLLGLLGSFTFLERVWRVVIWVAWVSLGGALLRIGLVLRGVGCTAAGTWRAGAGMEHWSLWGARTSRLRCAVFALSLGRSRRRFWGMGAYRRRRFYRAREVRGARSLLAMSFWLRVVMRRLMSCARMLVRGFPTTWCLQR